MYGKKECADVTIISSLPPIIGLSPYTKGLVSTLSRRIKVYFLGFNRIYPAFLYPGKMYDPTASLLNETPQLTIRNVLNWYNPLGWILEAWKIKTRIVHAQWWSFPLALTYFTILGINKIRGKKIVLTIHNVKPHERHFIKNFLNQFIFFLADAYIVHTPQNKGELAKITKQKPIYVVPHGPIETPLSNLSKKDARRILKIFSNDKVLLCFGHIRHYKGLDTALKALAEIKDNHIKLIIAGKCWEDWQKYQKIIDSLSLNDRIIMKTDYIPNDIIEAIFKASDLVLLPYRHFDAQSGVGSLVASFGIPMIVSRTGGLPHYVSHEVCLIEPENHLELADKILKILNDRALYDSLIEDIEKNKNKINWDSIALQTIKIYETILD